MKILLTGASSFIGFHFMRYFAREGVNITGTYRTMNSNVVRLQNDTRISLIQLDMADCESFSILPAKIDSVIHIAAVSEGPGIIPDDIIRCNVNGTKNLLNYVRRAGAQTVIYTSSLSVHGNIYERLVDEKTALNAPGLYGITKYLGERLISECGSGLATAAIRLPGVLGRGAHRAWIPSLCELAEENSDLNIYNPEASFNNAIHVSDLAEFVCSLLTKKFDGCHAFPIGASGGITVLEICERIIAAKNSRSRIQIMDSKQAGFIVSSSYAAQNFSYMPKSIDEILEMYLADSRT